MPQKPLTIDPVTLHPALNDGLTAISSKYPVSCTIKTWQCQGHLPEWRGGAPHPDRHKGADPSMG
ncbi:hypothetical protein AB1K83_07265 [Sporosarcina sp. 179-K 3D1 HS]|uniref:hypothetical protein n=1 Tax=Sporosarcina sp. 179-K 3D1 HS TaxID=3232169 RepID=UPI0039A3B6AD